MSTAATTAPAQTAAPSHSRGALYYATRLFNPLVLLFAGTRLLPLYAVIEHRGRRSGKVFRNPVVVRPTEDGFVIPMPWGERTDWCRNVRAAGECIVRWKGRDYPMAQPEVIPAPSTAPAVVASFSPFQRAMMARLGITHCLRLRHQSVPARTGAASR